MSISDDEFRQAVHAAVTRGLTSYDIAVGCTVSHPTVMRWLAGTNAPATDMRPGVVAKLAELTPPAGDDE